MAQQTVTLRCDGSELQAALDRLLAAVTALPPQEPIDLALDELWETSSEADPAHPGDSIARFKLTAYLHELIARYDAPT